jgi:DNA-3-methyladenine glycosylase II
MIDVACRGPYDLGLSLRAMRSFGSVPPPSVEPDQADKGDSFAAEGGPEESESTFRLTTRVDGRATVVYIWQTGSDPAVVAAESRPVSSREALRILVERVINATLDLDPFYRLTEAHPVLGPVTRELYGLKPFRPAGLFEMLVIAVVEQQISLAAAAHIRAHLVERFGDEVEGLPVFPRAEVLAEASLDSLRNCGLSLRKAEYVSGVARQVAEGTLDLEELEDAPAEEVRTRITALRGFGPWSADYVLVRGLGRVDVVPTDDLGIRNVLGRMFRDGTRPTAEEAGRMLAPFAPFRGLAAFYLLVGARMGVPT